MWLQWNLDIISIPLYTRGEFRDILQDMLQQNAWSFAESSNHYGEEGDTPQDEMPISVFVPSDEEEKLHRCKSSLSHSFPSLMSQVLYLDDALWQNPWSKTDTVAIVTKHFALNSPTEDSSRFNLRFTSSDQVFGDGRHVSTRLILELLDLAFTAKPTPQKMLDVGCGNGILAIASAMFGIAEVVATDLDRPILDAAKANAINHGVDANLCFIETAHIPEARFPLICANILAPALLALSKDLCNALEPGGRLLLAGFQRLELSQILEAFRELRLGTFKEDQGWLAVELNKD